VSQRGAAEDVIGDIRLRISVRPFDWPTVPKAINPCPLSEHELHTFYLIHVTKLIDPSFPGQPSITHTITVKILTESINLYFVTKEDFFYETITTIFLLGNVDVQVKSYTPLPFLLQL
jgi:hypothetical protein